MTRPAVALAGVVLVGGAAALAWRSGRSDRVPEQLNQESVVAAHPAAPAPIIPASAAEPDMEPAASVTPPPSDSASSDLPDDAPEAVSFGVVLVTYRGAEQAPGGARTKSEALALAKELVTAGRTNFGDAVKRGDRGSVEDAGRIPQGVLEPAVERALFTLKKGEVYGEPVDTPRGFWVLRRTE
jgi:hypothetical protein